MAKLRILCAFQAFINITILQSITIEPCTLVVIYQFIYNPQVRQSAILRVADCLKGQLRLRGFSWPPRACCCCALTVSIIPVVSPDDTERTCFGKLTATSCSMKITTGIVRNPGIIVGLPGLWLGIIRL